MDINQIRRQFPQYDDLSDEQLAGAVHKKFYSDMPRAEFDQRVGLKAKTEAEAVPQVAQAGAAGAEQGYGAGLFDAVTSGMSLGFGDELTAAESALLGRTPEGGWFDYSQPMGERYDRALEAERAQGRQFAKENPVSAIAGEIGGGILTGGGAARSGLTLAGQIVNAPKRARLATRAGAAALEGAGYGAVAGAGYSEGGLENRLEGAAQGAGTGVLVGGALPVIGAGVRRLTQRAAVPREISQLQAAKDAAYKAVDDSGFQYSPGQIGTLADDISKQMQASGINPIRHPKAASMVDDIQGMKSQPMTLTQVDQLRQVVSRDVANAADQAEARLGKLMIRRIDNFLEKQGGSDLIKPARAANAQLKKAEQVDRAVRTADLRAASTGSGGNVNNATRQNVRKLLEKAEAGKANFSVQERELMEQVVRGTAPQNVARLIGKFSPSGNGLMAALSLGATAYNPLMAIPGGAGLLAKAFADKGTMRNVRALELAIRGAATSKQQQRAANRILGNEQIMSALRNALVIDAAENFAVQDTAR